MSLSASSTSGRNCLRKHHLSARFHGIFVGEDTCGLCGRRVDYMTGTVQSDAKLGTDARLTVLDWRLLCGS
jgi:hypothetical protein